MALILICVLLLPCGYAIVQAFILYHENRAWLVQTLERTAALVSSHQSEFFSKTRLLLEAVAASPDVGAAPTPECAALLQSALRQTRDYGSFMVVDEAGVVRCGSASDLVGAGVGDRAWFRNLREGLSFAISKAIADRSRPRPTVIAGVPLHDSNGAFAGALAVSVDLGMLDARMRRLALPDDAVVFLSDENGVVLARDAAQAPEIPGRLPSKEQIVRLIGSATGADVRGRSEDRVERRFITTPIRNTPLYVVLGLPILDQWSWLERDLLLGLFAPSLMLALAIAAIWIATDLLVIRHVATLARAARRYTSGHLEASPRLAGAPSELRDLATAFARMMQGISQREEELKESLEQKDLLLRETHHRVKNDLQIVTSLLNLRVRSVPSAAAQRAMLEAQTRIKALALVHRSLYEHPDIDMVDLRSLVGELCQLLQDSVEPPPGGVAIKLDVAPAQVKIDKAIPIALLITEAVTNCLEHAFPDGRSGTIAVRLLQRDRSLQLVVADDGVGIGGAPHVLGAAEAGRGPPCGVGLRLIDMLAKQIGAKVRIDGPPGTRVSLSLAS